MSIDHPLSDLPLVAARAFEAAARHGSFTVAARELRVTQGAISRHVRALEDRYGVRLFERRGRAVILTSAGRSFLEPVEEAMGLLRTAAHRLQASRNRERTLTISLLPSVAALWLAPRLADFMAKHPRLELKIHASRNLVDFAAEFVDVAIRYGPGEWPHTNPQLLARESLSPVCSPDFVRQHRIDGDPSCLPRLPLLSDDLTDQWNGWSSAAGVVGDLSEARLRFDDSTSLYHAAESGMGLALGRSLLVQRALEEGRLVRPFDVSVPASYAYWIVTPDRGVRPPAARLFVQWLRRQCEDER